MKTLLFTGVFLTVIHFMTAQHISHHSTAENKQVTENTTELAVGHHAKLPFVVYIEPMISYMQSRTGEGEISIGASGGIIYRNWIFGLYGEHAEAKHPATDSHAASNLSIHHEGLRLSYIFQSNEHHQWVAGLQTGWGAIRTEEQGEHGFDKQRISVIIPEIGYVVPINSMLHIQATVGYHYVSGYSHPHVASRSLNGTFVQLGFTFAPHK